MTGRAPPSSTARSMRARSSNAGTQPTPTPILSRRQADGTFRAVEDAWEASRVATKQLGISDPPLIGPGTIVLTAMNGVPWWFFDRLAFGSGKLRLESLDPGGALERAMPTGRIVGCVVHFAASTPEPGLIRHGMGKRLILGEPGGRNSDRTAKIVAALREAGFEPESSAFIEKEFWLKLLSGKVALRALSGLLRNIRLASIGLNRATASAQPFQTRMAQAWQAFKGNILLILSGDDYTAKEFLEYSAKNTAWDNALTAPRTTRHDVALADHTFSDPHSRSRVENLTLAWLTSRADGPRVAAG